MRWTKQMRASRSRSSRCAAASVKALELVGIEKIDLFITNLVHNGPMIPHTTSQTDKNGSFAAIIKK